MTLITFAHFRVTSVGGGTSYCFSFAVMQFEGCTATIPENIFEASAFAFGAGSLGGFVSITGANIIGWVLVSSRRKRRRRRRKRSVGQTIGIASSSWSDKLIVSRPMEIDAKVRFWNQNGRKNIKFSYFCNVPVPCSVDENGFKKC